MIFFLFAVDLVIRMLLRIFSCCRWRSGFSFTVLGNLLPLSGSFQVVQMNNDARRKNFIDKKISIPKRQLSVVQSSSMGGEEAPLL